MERCFSKTFNQHLYYLNEVKFVSLRLQLLISYMLFAQFYILDISDWCIVFQTIILLFLSIFKINFSLLSKIV